MLRVVEALQGRRGKGSLVTPEVKWCRTGKVVFRNGVHVLTQLGDEQGC